MCSTPSYLIHEHNNLSLTAVNFAAGGPLGCSSSLPGFYVSSGRDHAAINPVGRDLSAGSKPTNIELVIT